MESRVFSQQHPVCSGLCTRTDHGEIHTGLPGPAADPGGHSRFVAVEAGGQGEGIVEVRAGYPAAEGVTAAWPSGLGKGLQSPVPGFDSQRRLQGTPGQRPFLPERFSVSVAPSHIHPISRVLRGGTGWYQPDSRRALTRENVV